MSPFIGLALAVAILVLLLHLWRVVLPIVLVLLVIAAVVWVIHRFPEWEKSLPQRPHLADDLKKSVHEGVENLKRRTGHGR